MLNKSIENSYSKILKDNDVLTRDEEILLFEKILKGDSAAREKIILSNLRFVVTLALRYQGNNDINDIISAGNIGLIKSVGKFDPLKEVRFTTYAGWWINESIIRYLHKNNEVVNAPQEIIRKLKSINNISDKLSLDLGRSPTLKEISFITEIPIETIKSLKKNEVKSILNDDLSNSVFDSLIDNSNQPDESAYVEERKGKLKSSIDRLSPNEKFIVSSLYEFNDTNSSLTLSEIGKRLSLSRERVRQINISALHRLKRYVSEYKDD